MCKNVLSMLQKCHAKCYKNFLNNVLTKIINVATTNKNVLIMFLKMFDKMLLSSILMFEGTHLSFCKNVTKCDINVHFNVNLFPQI